MNRQALFDDKAISMVYELISERVRQECEVWGLDSLEANEVIVEWVYFATDQSRSEGLEGCKYIDRLDPLRERLALARDLPAEASWNEILSKELERYTEPIETALREGLTWTDVKEVVHRNSIDDQIRQLGLSPDSTIDEINEATRSFIAQTRDEISGEREKRRQLLERARETHNLPSTMSLQEIHRWIDREYLRKRIRDAQNQDLPPDALDD